MPQSGSIGVSVEAVDLRYVEANWTTRLEMVVGWYHSHPVFDINPQMLIVGQEPRQTTSNIRHLNKPSIQNRNVAQFAQKSDPWMTLPNFTEHTEINGKSVNSMLTLAESYNKSVQEESTMTHEQLKTRYVGKQVQKRHLAENVEDVMSNNIGSRNYD
ncbi:16227_t:CDS:2 [Funneliformis mosseae]|uniref:16227_t:CDS:1 n=1 Tax=Funneliformis mosseae TaxID=27381 RepID=A0A9N8ZG73_FUNMO|nr:16227_t:CDS:2 [Funneliformis mosseae]